ncbi:hypothetical protein Tco_1203906 [Tanacetum coccineum]
MIENVNQNTYAYADADVQSQNQDLLMTTSKLIAKLIYAQKWKNANTRFDKSSVLGKLVYVTPLNKHKNQKSKSFPKIDVKQDASKPVTSCSSPKIEKVKSNKNVTVCRMYRVKTKETPTSLEKTSVIFSNSPRVVKSHSVSKPTYKRTNLKKSVLLNIKDRCTSKESHKEESHIMNFSNKSVTSTLNVSKTKTNALNAKDVNTMNACVNVLCVSYGKDVFTPCHDMCVARYVLFVNSRAKRALFTSL